VKEGNELEMAMFKNKKANNRFEDRVEAFSPNDDDGGVYVLSPPAKLRFGFAIATQRDRYDV
jgi:hypothetical protein